MAKKNTKKDSQKPVTNCDAFVAMRRFIIQNANILMRIANLERHQLETDEKTDAILSRQIPDYRRQGSFAWRQRKGHGCWNVRCD